MKNLLEKEVSDEIIDRIKKLTENSKPEWGKMDAAQMLAHCLVPFETVFGDLNPKRSFIGILIGGFIKKKVFTEEPFKKNLPTGKEFIINDKRDIEKEKNRFISAIEKFRNMDPVNLSKVPHPFFGNLTSDEWGILLWKHTDHHLTQFSI